MDDEKRALLPRQCGTIVDLVTGRVRLSTRQSRMDSWYATIPPCLLRLSLSDKILKQNRLQESLASKNLCLHTANHVPQDFTGPDMFSVAGTEPKQLELPVALE